MLILCLGLFIWSCIHFVPSMAPDVKSAWKAKLGVGGYAGTFSLLIIFSIVLMSNGWQDMRPVHLYSLPPFFRHLGMLMVLVAFVLVVAGRYPSRIRQHMRHPMLIGFKLWALAHLFANGDSRSLLLFGGLLVWAVIQVVAINRRDGREPREIQVLSLPADIGLMALSVAAYFLIAFYAHVWFSGVRLM